MSIIEVYVDATQLKASIDRYRVEQTGRAMMMLERVGVDMVSKTSERLKWRYSKGKGKGGRYTGLLSEYRFELERNGEEVTLTVGTGVKYAKYVEGWPEPPRRHFLPFSVAPDFKVWLEKHGVKVPDSAKGWMTGGEEATTPHLGPAADQVLPKAIPQLIELSRGL